jgi:hypothetical protein
LSAGGPYVNTTKKIVVAEAAIVCWLIRYSSRVM